MSRARKITLGGAEHEIPPFTLGEVQTLLPLFKAESLETVAGMAALCTIVHTGAKKSPTMQGLTFEAFQNLAGVTVPELLEARNVIGRAIGYLAEEKPAPGEAAGAESP